MSAPPAPSEADLAAKADGLKKVETKEGGSGVDTQVFEKLWDDNGGDVAKMTAAMGWAKGPKEGITKEDFLKTCWKYA
eukprot:CAMPEP_0204601638 /NCGR_PEP_ID=MMETSP0661-20131031/56159_1 /ASSEMBLY_ACC=CAM_ASM_000606 /TAXON_ID=109239 /ORGANISM="Alexandrium margalefi, Strain AMGDE01CS-322" /LENGTH=77 /DNA_ID=CAMNT_0051612533 /DNA_START=80 /DNA_END=313 /DNA_ORIENTATION=+